MRFKILFVILLVAILSLGLLSLRSNIFIIKSVDVYLDKIECADEIQIRDSAHLYGQNLILLNPSKAINNLKSNFLCIKDIQISRNFPKGVFSNQVSIFASGREPKAIILVSKEKEATESASIENIATPSARIHEVISSFLVDDQGILFAKDVNLSNIPKVYYYEDLTLGQTSTQSILDAIRILEKIKLYGLDVQETEVRDDLFLIYPNLGVPRIVFRLEENFDTQLASLQLISSQAKIDENELEFIDLRFDKPVVRLAPKKK